jgi:hypothetical protein
MCREDRDEDKIDVTSYKLKNAEYVQVNLRHCVDKPECTQAAKDAALRREL